MTLKEYLDKNYKPYYSNNKTVNFNWEFQPDENARKRGYNGIIIKSNGSQHDVSITYIKSKNAYKVNI